jgi:hypothetical protein
MGMVWVCYVGTGILALGCGGLRVFFTSVPTPAPAPFFVGPTPNPNSSVNVGSGTFLFQLTRLRLLQKKGEKTRYGNYRWRFRLRIWFRVGAGGFYGGGMTA